VCGYVIVGAGSVGGVLAARLGEDGFATADRSNNAMCTAFAAGQDSVPVRDVRA
jgi:hypothetical protein